MKAPENTQIIMYPVATEKAIRLLEAENVLVFTVDMRSDKLAIRKAVEEQFKVRVTTVRTLVNKKGKKVAYVKLGKNSPAIDIATNLGLI